MKSMKKSLFLVLGLFSLLVISSAITGASATKGWIKSEILPSVRHTANNPGNIKICGDHKCSPFEDMKKSLHDKLKQNQSVNVLIKNQSKMLFTKKVK
jgi:hypothetical protein